MSRRLIVVLAVPLLAIIGLTAVAVGMLQMAQIDQLMLVQEIIGEEPLPDWAAQTYRFLELPLRLLFVLVVFSLAWLVTRVSWRLAGWLLKIARYEGFSRRPPLPKDLPDTPSVKANDRRLHTIQLLTAGFINLTAVIVAFILAAGQFVNLVNLAVVSTIVANAFGFAARDYIGDFLNGVSNIFENRFDIGDNVAVFKVGDTIEGVVEQVTVRTLSIRTRSGELIVVPQGEVRILRNYSRGSFTGTAVTVHVAAADLPTAMTILLSLAAEAPELLPDLLEPWRVISRDGALGGAAELQIHAKARYGRGAELRLRIMMLVEDRLASAGIKLSG